MTLAVWLGFLLAAVLIAVTPGPGAVISMGTGLRLGYGAALRAILGLQAAILIHLAIVALGLGALLAASPAAYAGLKFVGAAYLVWLGLDKWRAQAPTGMAAAPSADSRPLFVQGVLVNLTNPKAIVFIGALVPQFVDPRAPLLGQYLLIAVTLCATDLSVMSGYALAAARLGRWLDEPRHLLRLERGFGAVLVAAGLLLAISSAPG